MAVKKKGRAPARTKAVGKPRADIELGGEKINMVFSGDRLVSFDSARYVIDPQTRRKWVWLERDQPGLLDFLDDFVHRWHPFVVTGHKSRRNLATGRPAAIKARKKQSKEKLLILDGAISQLFEHGEGHKMTNEGIRDFLLKRNLSSYSEKSTLRHVNTIAARYRKPTT